MHLIIVSIISYKIYNCTISLLDNDVQYFYILNNNDFYHLEVTELEIYSDQRSIYHNIYLQNIQFFYRCCINSKKSFVIR